MFCKTCGKEVHANAVTCTGCGCAIAPAGQGGQAWGIGMMIFLCLSSLIIPLVGWIVGGFYLKHPTRRGQAIALIVLGIVGLLLTLGGFWDGFWEGFYGG